MLGKAIFITVIILINTAVEAANVTIHKNEISGLLSWTADDDGFSLELIQLLPDFIRAIYAKHNFPE